MDDLDHAYPFRCEESTAGYGPVVDRSPGSPAGYPVGSAPDARLSDLSRTWQLRLLASRVAAWIQDRGSNSGSMPTTWLSDVQEHRVSMLGEIDQTIADRVGHLDNQGADLDMPSLMDLLGIHSHEAAVHVGLLLPRAGDPRGLSSSPHLLEGALDSTVALRVNSSGDRDDVIMIPQRLHEGLLMWGVGSQPTTAFGTALPGDGADPAEADRVLRRAILESEERLADLGLSGLGQQARDAWDAGTESWREGWWPRSMDPRRRSLMARGVNLAWMRDIAAMDDAPIVTLSDDRERRAVLDDLDRWSRRAIEVAVSSPSWHRD